MAAAAMADGRSSGSAEKRIKVVDTFRVIVTRMTFTGSLVDNDAGSGRR
jgi:hypothetical protein